MNFRTPFAVVLAILVAGAMATVSYNAGRHGSSHVEASNLASDDEAAWINQNCQTGGSFSTRDPKYATWHEAYLYHLRWEAGRAQREANKSAVNPTAPSTNLNLVAMNRAFDAVENIITAKLNSQAAKTVRPGTPLYQYLTMNPNTGEELMKVWWDYDDAKSVPSDQLHEAEASRRDMKLSWYEQHEGVVWARWVTTSAGRGKQYKVAKVGKDDLVFQVTTDTNPNAVEMSLP